MMAFVFKIIAFMESTSPLIDINSPVIPLISFPLVTSYFPSSVIMLGEGVKKLPYWVEKWFWFGHSFQKPPCYRKFKIYLLHLRNRAACDT